MWEAHWSAEKNAARVGAMLEPNQRKQRRPLDTKHRLINVRDFHLCWPSDLGAFQRATVPQSKDEP